MSFLDFFFSPDFTSFVAKTFQRKRRGVLDDHGHPVRGRETLPAQWLKGETQILAWSLRFTSRIILPSALVTRSGSLTEGWQTS